MAARTRSSRGRSWRASTASKWREAEAALRRCASLTMCRICAAVSSAPLISSALREQFVRELETEDPLAAIVDVAPPCEREAVEGAVAAVDELPAELRDGDVAAFADGPVAAAAAAMISAARASERKGCTSEPQVRMSCSRTLFAAWTARFQMSTAASAASAASSRAASETEGAPRLANAARMSLR
eukprot:4594727-Pleurochrysis_carterae.AAC.1